jgi:23S rRNA (adenine2030-N6)-methyltransferase
MNYRHGFHAGNFADLAKHAAVLSFLRHLRQTGLPLRVIDTHAGAGQYDLSDETFARSKEAEAGIKYLLSQDVPQSLKPLSDYVWAKNRSAGFRDRLGLYPGSPVLILDHLPLGANYMGCELRPDDYRLLAERIEPRGRARRADGYEIAVESLEGEAEVFMLIDPPFELSDDYERIADTLAQALLLKPSLMALIWLPIKDLETFDRFLRHLECAVLEDQTGQGPRLDIIELRLRPLNRPMKMNGCALVSVNAPPEVIKDIGAIAQDVIKVFGELGAEARIWQMD